MEICCSQKCDCGVGCLPGDHGKAQATVKKRCQGSVSGRYGTLHGNRALGFWNPDCHALGYANFYSHKLETAPISFRQRIVWEVTISYLMGWAGTVTQYDCVWGCLTDDDDDGGGGSLHTTYIKWYILLYPFNKNRQQSS